MSYVCLWCGQLFDEPYEYEETYGLDSPPYQKFLVSPCCKDAFCVAKYCDVCGGVLTEDYIRIEALDKNVCEDCYEMRTWDDDL